MSGPFEDDDDQDQRTDANRVRVTLKGDGAPPWITVDGKDIADTLAQFKEHGRDLQELMKITGKAASEFATHVPVAPRGGSSKSDSKASRTKPTEVKECEHGEMKYQEGVKNGRAWKAYFCPSEDRRDQCDPIWIRNNG